MAGKVRVNDQWPVKPSDQVKPEDRIEVEEPEKYVSRGGFKLEKALESFPIEIKGTVAIDLGVLHRGLHGLPPAERRGKDFLCGCRPRPACVASAQESSRACNG